MTAKIVDYRMDRKGTVFGKCFCGTEQKLSADEVRKLATSNPEVFLKVSSS